MVRPEPPDARTLVVRFYEDAWNRADETAARALLDPAVRFASEMQRGEVTGQKAVLTHMRAMRGALANFQCAIDDLVASTSRAAVRLTFSGTHVDTLLDIPATGRHVSWSAAGFFTAAQGRLVDIWVLGDTETLRHQLTS